MTDSFHPTAQSSAAPPSWLSACPPRGCAKFPQRSLQVGVRLLSVFQCFLHGSSGSCLSCGWCPGGVPLVTARAHLPCGVACPHHPMRAHACGCPFSLLNMESGTCGDGARPPSRGWASPSVQRPAKQSWGFLEKRLCLKKARPSCPRCQHALGSDSQVPAPQDTTRHHAHPTVLFLWRPPSGTLRGCQWLSICHSEYPACDMLF